MKSIVLVLYLQNDERSMQRNTSHVPNRAIPMNTFHRYPKSIEFFINSRRKEKKTKIYQNRNDANAIGNSKSDFKTFSLEDLMKTINDFLLFVVLLLILFSQCLNRFVRVDMNAIMNKMLIHQSMNSRNS